VHQFDPPTQELLPRTEKDGRRVIWHLVPDRKSPGSRAMLRVGQHCHFRASDATISTHFSPMNMKKRLKLPKAGGLTFNNLVRAFACVPQMCPTSSARSLRVVAAQLKPQ